MNHSRIAHRARQMAAILVFGATVTYARPSAAQAPAKDYSPADVTFMQGMIYHHAQAVIMADWAPTHGASHSVALFCKKVALSQASEIRLMQQWLLDRGEHAPDPLGYLPHAGKPAADTGAGMTMPGMKPGGVDLSGHMMPGMLTPEQMALLNASRDSTFDRLFLIFMIQHHEGALGMVKDLLASPMGGQQADVFAFANGVNAGQTAEIRVMQGLLNAYN